MTVALGTAGNNLQQLMFASGTGGTGTNYRTTWLPGGDGPGAAVPTAIMHFPTLNTSNSHLQNTTTASTSCVMVANDDVTKCIVVDSFEANWNSLGASNPKALFGTLAEEGATSDLIVWMVSYLGGSFATSSPIKLGPGKDLIHYNIKGPGQNDGKKPAFFKLYYHLVDA